RAASPSYHSRNGQASWLFQAEKKSSRRSQTRFWERKPRLGWARKLLALTQTDEKNRTQHNEKDVRKPDQQLRMYLRIVPKGVGDDDKKEIRNGDDQAEKKTNGGLLPMRGNANRQDNERKSK